MAATPNSVEATPRRHRHPGEMVSQVQAAIEAAGYAISHLSHAGDYAEVMSKRPTRMEKSQYTIRRLSLWLQELAHAVPTIEAAIDEIGGDALRAVDAEVVNLRLYPDPLRFDTHLSATSAAWPHLLTATLSGSSLLSEIWRVVDRPQAGWNDARFLREAADRLESLEPGEKYSIADWLAPLIERQRVECEQWFGDFPGSHQSVMAGLEVERLRLSPGNKDRSPVWPERVVKPLRSLQRKLVEAMNEAGGAVRIDDFAEIAEWVAPYDNSAKQLIKNLNTNLAKRGEKQRIHRHDNEIRIKAETDT